MVARAVRTAVVRSYPEVNVNFKSFVLMMLGLDRAHSKFVGVEDGSVSSHSLTKNLMRKPTAQSIALCMSCMWPQGAPGSAFRHKQLG